MIKDLTSGKPMKLILSFSIPVFLGYLFQQFYNVIDTVIVGKFLGVSALAAVGSTGSINFLIVGFCMGLCNGFCIPIANKFGAKDYKTLRQYVAMSWVLTIVISIVFAVITVLICKPMLVWMKTPSDILQESYNYIVIIFVGIPIVMVYNLMAGIIRSLGDSKTPLYFLLISSVLNIILDLCFILIFKLGVAGAALATVISQLIASVLCFIYMKSHYDIIRLEKDDKKIRRHHFTVLLGMGVPMGLQYSITAIGSVILQAAVNSLGSSAVAAISVASKICMFFCCPFDAMGTTMATYGGQNTGARKFERLNTGLYSCSLLGLIYSVLAFVIMFFFGEELGRLFLNQEDIGILSDVRMFLIGNSIFYFPLALVNIIRFMIQGMGFSKLAIFAGMFELIGRSVFGLFFVPLFGFKAACVASPMAWILADCFLIPAYYKCRNKVMKEEIQ